MSEDSMSNKRNVGRCSHLCFGKDKITGGIAIEDPDNAEILSIFDSSNHQNLFSKLESKNLNQHDYNVF